MFVADKALQKTKATKSSYLNTIDIASQVPSLGFEIKKKTSCASLNLKSFHLFSEVQVDQRKIAKRERYNHTLCGNRLIPSCNEIKGVLK